MKEKGFALAITICFPTLGFFLGYLYTRLFLSQAFSRADQSQDEIRSEMENAAKSVGFDNGLGKEGAPPGEEGGRAVSESARESGKTRHPQRRCFRTPPVTGSRAGV